MTKAQTHQVVVGENDLWETPKILLEEKLEELNIKPIIDVFASKSNYKFSKYYTQEDSAFNHELTETFFANPEYSNITESMKFLYNQHLKHNVTGIILVFAKTSVKWWHRFVEGKAETHFQKGRIRFLLNGIEPRYCKHCKLRIVKEVTHCHICNNKVGKSSPTYDSVWLVYRKKEEIK